MIGNSTELQIRTELSWNVVKFATDYAGNSSHGTESYEMIDFLHHHKLLECSITCATCKKKADDLKLIKDILK